MVINNDRVVVFAKDVMNITGRSKTFSYRLIGNIKKTYGKDKKCFVGVEEFCDYTGLRKNDVLKFIR